MLSVARLSLGSPDLERKGETHGIRACPCSLDDHAGGIRDGDGEQRRLGQSGASCQGILVSNATPNFAHVIQNDIRTTPGLEGPGIGSIVSGVASGPHSGSIEECLPSEG